MFTRLKLCSAAKRAAMCCAVLGVAALLIRSSCAQEDLFYHDDFADGDIGPNSAGGWWPLIDGFGTADVSSGDFVADSPAGWSMWYLPRFDGNSIPRRSEWSFRADVTFGSGFLAVGKQSYHHAGVWITDTNWDRFWPGGTLEAGIARSVEYSDVSYEVEGERLSIQVDVLDDTITAYVWREGDPDSLKKVNYDQARPVVEYPSFGVIGSSTIHDVWISSKPIPINFVAGDFNSDGVLNANDIDLLSKAIGTANFTFDSNADNVVDSADHKKWVHDLKKTWYGDANLDGEFSSLDLVGVFQAGKFETDQAAGWSDGDWNGDQRFTTTDFVTAFQDGGYERGPRVAVAAVPEPPSGALIAIGAAAALGTARRRVSRVKILSINLGRRQLLVGDRA